MLPGEIKGLYVEQCVDLHCHTGAQTLQTYCTYVK